MFLFYLMHCTVLLSLFILINKLFYILPWGTHWFLCSFEMCPPFCDTSVLAGCTRCLEESRLIDLVVSLNNVHVQDPTEVTPA